MNNNYLQRSEAYFETQRLILRPLEVEDFDLWKEGFINKLSKQHKYDDGQLTPKDFSLTKFKKFITRHKKLWKEDKIYLFASISKETNKQIGFIGFSTLLRENFQWGIVHYGIHNTYQNQGYGTENLIAGLDIAFQKLGFQRIEAHINTDNERSLKIAHKAGMKLETVREKFIFEFDEWTDNAIFYRLKN